MTHLRRGLFTTGTEEDILGRSIGIGVRNTTGITGAEKNITTSIMD
jgi:hypothetical protein